ncbi:MAG: hypothetical protein JW889_09050 [Verrucomicrobia bacterium]|nr:hypothetical protein [Verrucomicrobiota bacterium]
MANHTYEAIVRRVRSVKRRWRALLIAEGLLYTAVVVLGVLLVGFVTDNVFHLVAPLRALALLAVIGAGATAFVARVVQRALKPISDDRAALEIEVHYPELENRLINSIQLGRGERYRNALADVVLTQTEDRIHQTPLEHSISAARLSRHAVLLVAAVLAGLAYFVSFPSYFRNAAARLVTFRDAPLPITRTLLEVGPGDVSIYRGDDVEVTAVPTGERIIDKVYVEVRLDGDERLDVMDFNGRAFVSIIPAVQHDGRYRVLADDFKSPWFTITTRTPLEVERLDLVLTYPGYLRLARPELLEGFGRRTAVIKDTSACLVVHTNRPAARGTLALDSLKRPLVEESVRQFAAEFVVEQDVAFSVSLSDAQGMTLRRPVTRRIVCLLDEVPEARLLEPQMDFEGPPEATLTILAKGSDDISLDSIVLLLDRGDGEKLTELRRWTYNAGTNESYDALKRVAIESYELKVAKYLRLGDTASVAIVVRDLKGNKTTSGRVRLKVVSSGEAERIASEQREAVYTRLRVLLEKQKQARAGMAALASALAAPASDLANLDAVRTRQFEIYDDSGALVELIGTFNTGAHDHLGTALTALRANEMVEVVKTIDAFAANANVTTKTAVLDVQDVIIAKLEALFGVVDEATTPEQEPDEQRQPNEPDVEKAKIFRELKDVLDAFIDEQRRVIEALENLKGMKPEDYTDEQLKLQEQLKTIEDQWSKFLQEKSAELDKVPEQVFSDPTLLKELRMIYEEVDLAADELSKPGVDIKVTEEQVSEGLEMASELTHELERWLTAESDKIKWDLDEPSEPLDVPYAELPEELADIIGDLIREEEELSADMEDVSSSWTDSLDASAGWDAMDGPISNMSAKGVTGNVLPNSTEIGGRSGEGRQGKSHGEFVSDTAIGKGGRRTPTRNTNDPYENATVNDQMDQATGGATGGGKRSGAGGEGLPGHVPPDLQVEMVRLNGKQADLIVKGERLMHNLARFNYNADKLREVLDLMRTLSYRLGDYRYTDLVGAHKEIVEELKTSRELLRHEYRTRREEEAAVPPKVRRVLNDTMETEFPDLYGDLLREYYKAISE